MLQIIDQRWRDHLAEMDYLREGINLRAMGQQDPLVAWQREGFAMFGQLIDAIDDDYLRYVLHVEALAGPGVRARPRPRRLRGGRRPGGEWPDGGPGHRPAEPAVARLGPGRRPPSLRPATARPRRRAVAAQPPATNGRAPRPTVRGATPKLGRNEPCWCGSGKKFKLCHGAA